MSALRKPPCFFGEIEKNLLHLNNVNSTMIRKEKMDLEKSGLEGEGDINDRIIRYLQHSPQHR